jgi:ribosomal protein L11 methyltransferase
MAHSLVRLVVSAADVEAAGDVLRRGGATAIEERDADDGFWLLADADAAAVARIADGRWSVEVVAVDLDAALDGWRPYARVHRVGPRIVVRPPWVPWAAGPGDVVVEVDPGHAFGSGSHPSTLLALAALDAHRDRVGEGAVLDVGCGSGILAVAAALLGAPAVTAVDVEPVAVEVTRANARRNWVADRVEASTTPATEIHGRFGVVVVNVDRRVVIDLAPAVAALAAPGGLVVLSGFLDAHTDEVVAAFPGLRVLDRRTEDGWAAVMLQVPASSATTGAMAPMESPWTTQYEMPHRSRQPRTSSQISSTVPTQE